MVNIHRHSRRFIDEVGGNINHHMLDSIRKYDDKMIDLVQDIFTVIPSYYDEDEASTIAELITEYTTWVVEQRS